MKRCGRRVWFGLAVLGCALLAGAASAADEPPLTIVENGASQAVIVVDPDAAAIERQAAEDLAKYIELMTGARLALADQPAAIQQALAGAAPALVIGEAALKADPSLKQVLAKAAKPRPVLNADAIALRRRGNRVLLAGTNAHSHYYAVSELLHRWGCRWYLPTEFGECIPEHRNLRIGLTDFAHGSPFEVRRYWISWVGDTTGAAEFKLRNFFNEVVVPSGHCLAQYTKELVPPGKSVFHVPITPDTTADHVAAQIEKTFGEGKHVMLGIEDGVYQSDDPLDKELISLQFDKYFMTQSVTDAFMIFYNKVAQRVMKKHPNSPAKIGFLIYANLTMPPVREVTAAPPLVGYLAPIDIDPIHHMDDPRSKPRREYKEMLYQWAKVMQGRLVIYDYDQGMLVWRDIPAPSHQMLRHDVHHYRKAGILGVDTESRNAIGTIFTNLFFRGQLLWNPEADVDALLDEFYPKFYGPAAEPMRGYWSAIYKAWEDTIVTEHEYFLAPAVYTPELVAELGQRLQEAEAAMSDLRNKANPSRNEQLYLQRMQFTRLSYTILSNYMAMVHAAATEVDYAPAVAAGQRGLVAREALTEMNGTFTTYKRIGENGPAWWPGEVQTYQELLALTDGSKGKLLAKLPLEWAFRRDSQNVGLKENWATAEVDLDWYNQRSDKGSLASRVENPGHWEMLRSDRYIQAQGVISPEGDILGGYGWYRTEVELSPPQAQQKLRLMFPGLFNECWLYVNGQEVAHRPQHVLWWMNDYRFFWDVDLAGKLKPGKNTIALRFHNPHHMGGMFRRPFLYVPAAP